MPARASVSITFSCGVPIGSYYGPFGLGGAARRDHARIDPRPVGPAHAAAVLDLHAAVLHDLEPRVAGNGFGLRVAQAELHPEHLGPARDRGTRERGHFRRLAKAIDD